MPVGAIYLTETSPGAPALSGTNGTLCAVLDWALPQKGWAIEYTATNNRIYWPGAGNRNRLFVSHDSAVSGAANFATIRGCENATAANAANLINPFPTVAQAANNASTIMVSATTSTTSRPYRIILTDRFIVMAVSSGSFTTSFWELFLYGDLYGTEAADSWATIVHIRNSATASNSYSSLLSCLSSYITSAKTFFCRSIDGTILSTRGCLVGSGLNTTDFGYVSGAPPIKGGYANRVEREKVAATCIGSNSSSVGSLAVYKRGWVPNLWNPVHFGAGGITSYDTFADSAYSVGSSFVFILSAISNGIGILEVTDSWSPPVG